MSFFSLFFWLSWAHLRDLDDGDGENEKAYEFTKVQANKIELFRLQHRDGKKKRIFSPSGSFKIGVGSTQPGHLKLAIKELRILSSIHSRIPAYASARWKSSLTRRVSVPSNLKLTTSQRKSWNLSIQNMPMVPSLRSLPTWIRSSTLSPSTRMVRTSAFSTRSRLATTKARESECMRVWQQRAFVHGIRQSREVSQIRRQKFTRSGHGWFWRRAVHGDLVQN